MAEGRNPAEVRVGEVIAKDLHRAQPDDDVAVAAQRMIRSWIRHLPVMVGDELVGVVSMRDLAGLIYKGMQDPEIVARLTGIELVRERRLARIQAGDLD